MKASLCFNYLIHMEDITRMKIDIVKLTQNVNCINEFLAFMEKCYNSLEMRLYKVNKKIGKKRYLFLNNDDKNICQDMKINN